MKFNKILFAALFLAACGGPLKYQVASSPKAPGADANIVADVREDQNQTGLEIEIKNLAPAGRVAEGATDYVAWYRKGSDTQWSRIGGVAYDTESREGKLSGTVPEKAFDLEITAEKAESPASPSPDVVFSQRVAK